MLRSQACDLKIEVSVIPNVFDDLEVAICNLKIGISAFLRIFEDLEITICDLKRKQVALRSHLLIKSKLKIFPTSAASRAVP
jgi:hypothetical protein